MRAALSLKRKAEHIAALNAYLTPMPPELRKRAILVLCDNGLLSAVGADLLIEMHGLEAV